MMLLLGDAVPAHLLLLQTWLHGHLLVQLEEAQHLQLADEFQRLELVEVPGLQLYNRRTTP
jgi:hypothetical protein